MKKILWIFILGLAFINICNAQVDLAPSSKSAILIDAKTGTVLYEKDADKSYPPASMTKIMSMLLIMEEIDKNNLSLDDKILISKKASSMGGSQLFLQEGESYPVKELLKGIAIASCNDAVVAMAEKIGGSVEGFVDMMNKKAKELGLKNTKFINPHGLDSEGHVSSARDMALMAKELLKHEKILEFTSIYEDYLKKNDGSSIWLVNTNKLVRFYEGVDGLKTGFTKEAGYCLTSTAQKNNLRLISVVMGEPTSDERSSDTTNMLNYGFNTYEIYTAFTKDTSLGSKRVEFGKKDVVNLALVNDYVKLLKKNEEKPNYSFEVNVDKLKAPLKKGDVVGKAKVIDNGNVIDEVDITVLEDIPKANLWDFFNKNLKNITAGKKMIK